MGASEETPPTLAEAVRLIRLVLGWSQAKFGAALGLDQSTISQYEIGRAVPSVEVLMKINTLTKKEKIAVRDTIFKQIEDRIGRGAVGDFWDDALGQYDNEPATPPESKWSSGKQQESLFSEELRSYYVADKLAFEISQDLVRLLRLYRQHHNQRRASAAFRKAADFIEVELSHASVAAVGAPAPKRRAKRKNLAINH